MFLLYSLLALARVHLNSVTHHDSQRGGDMQPISPFAPIRTLDLLAKLAVANLICPLECKKFSPPFQTLSMGSLTDGFMRSSIWTAGFAEFRWKCTSPSSDGPLRLSVSCFLPANRWLFNKLRASVCVCQSHTPSTPLPVYSTSHCALLFLHT